MKQIWRLSDDPSEWRWSHYTWLAEGDTPQDAMRSVVRKIKANNAEHEEWARSRGYEVDPDDADPVPQVMWAAPMRPLKAAFHLCGERHEIGEDFEHMFDYENAVEVRL